MKAELTKEIVASGKFYVYRLIDPRDGAAFYIGKGKGQRAHMHQKSAKAGKIDNVEKHRRISAILACGLDVRVEIVQTFDTETESLQFERRLIAMDRDRLTNIANGNKSNEELVAEQAIALFKSLPTVEQIELHSHKDQLRAVRKVFGSVSNYDSFVRGVLTRIFA